MKGEHGGACISLYPSCLCNRCKHDRKTSEENPYCYCMEDCPIEDCANFEPDDEEEGDEKCEN